MCMCSCLERSRVFGVARELFSMHDSIDWGRRFEDLKIREVMVFDTNHRFIWRVEGCER